MIKDITGLKYGNLTVTGVNKPGTNGRLWELKCICGDFCYTTSSDLERGRRNFCKNCKKLKSIKSGINIFYKEYIRNAKNRKYDFTLTFEDFEILIFQNCNYCDIEPLNKSKSTMSYIFKYNGIDRKDNSKGYSLENCVTCCKYCNIAKKDNDMEDFIQWINHLKSINCK